MIPALIQSVLSAIFIVIAGSFLTKSASRIAAVTGWGQLFVGGLLLAGATSLPELMVDIRSIRMNLPDLAVGDLLGSSLFNLLILSVLDFTFPSTFRRTAFSPAFLHHALAAVLTVLLTSIVGIGIASKFDISFFGVGLICWASFLVYLYGLRLIYLEGTLGDIQSVESKNIQPLQSKSRALAGAFLGYVVSAVAIVLVSPFLVESADDLARLTGLGHTFVGTTLVALSTSLPELISTLVAFRLGAPDLAIGNIFGSNAFNMILFIPLDFLYPGNLLADVRPAHAVTAFSVAATTSIAIMGQLYRKKERSRLTEPSSETVVAALVMLFLLLYWMKVS